MGIGGHILGDKKLNRLKMVTGVNFDRAYNRNNYGEGRVKTGETCEHYQINFKTMEIVKLDKAWHWASCYYENHEVITTSKSSES